MNVIQNPGVTARFISTPRNLYIKIKPCLPTCNLLYVFMEIKHFWAFFTHPQGIFLLSRSNQSGTTLNGD